jgi:CRISPR-associated exonuclease Cas4
MFEESDLLPISALQHLEYCERQCALIHIERQWDDNRFTAEGTILHERADSEERENRKNIRIARGLRIRSMRLGIWGQADVVEFHRVTDTENGITLPDAHGKWKPYPIEYKRGKPKSNRCDEVQLCAQALSIEEMLGVAILEGALYYCTPKRRTVIEFDANLRTETETTISRLHELIRSRQTPKAIYCDKCRQCSLKDICLPQIGSHGTVMDYIEQELGISEENSDETTP